MTAQDASLSTLTRDGKQAASEWMAELRPERLSQKARQLSQWADSAGRKLPDLSELGSPAVVTNVGPRERVVSLAAGVPLLLMSMRRGSHWVAKAPAGQTVSWNAEIIEDEPNRLISWRSLAGADVANVGSVRFDSLPEGEGTLVRVELEYVPPAGPLGAVVATLLGSSPAQAIAADLAGLSEVLPMGKSRRQSAKPELSEPLGV